MGINEVTVHPKIELQGNVPTPFNTVVSDEALKFVADLSREFSRDIKEVLVCRDKRQLTIDNGELPSFLPETESIRRSDWTIAPIPPDLTDRRVEITGPASDRKMVINALNSGAKTFMADFEDANSPTWANVLESQLNLYEAIRGTIHFTNPAGKNYELNENVATLIVRPRGLHLTERHVLIDGAPVPGALVDFGLYFFNNAVELQRRDSGPYFYLPKLESHLEARIWNKIFVYAEERMGIPQGTIKATVLIETILAAFEMDEILYELKEHSAGLNCGRWDYIFSYLKKLRNQSNVILPDRALVTMTSPFMRAYSLLTIKTCHRRNAHAIGGMAAQIPIKNDEDANQRALDKVRADKEREANDGHDGTWVAHPALVPVAMDVFNAIMPSRNQCDRQRPDVSVTSEDLLQVPEGKITEEGLRTNINVGVQYLEAWLRGSGAVPIFNLMEDAATAEISRAQVWQWIRHPLGILDDGRKVTAEMFEKLLAEELTQIRFNVGSRDFEAGKYHLAAQLFSDLILREDFVDFLTLPAYEHL